MRGWFTFKDHVHFSPPRSLKRRGWILIILQTFFSLLLLLFMWQLIISRNLLFVRNRWVASVNIFLCTDLVILFPVLLHRYYNGVPLIQITFSFSGVPLCVWGYFFFFTTTSEWAVRVLNVHEKQICCSPVLCWITESRSTQKTQSSIIP